MKIRTVIGIGVLATMLSVCTVSADYDKEITFRDIPWGTDVESSINDMDVGDFEIKDYDGYAPSLTDWLIYVSLDDQPFFNGIGLFATCNMPKVDLAGYKLKGITTYYFYDFASDDATKTNDKTKLYAATYNLYFDNVNDAYDDLTNKLTSLYGKYDIFDSRDNIMGGTCAWAVWKGANDTCVSLKKVDQTGTKSDSDLSLTYGWEGSTQIMEQSYESLLTYTENNLSSMYTAEDLDGL